LGLVGLRRNAISSVAGINSRTSCRRFATVHSGLFYHAPPVAVAIGPVGSSGVHGRGGRVSSLGRQPRSAEPQGHDPRHVGSTGTRARHTSRPLANEWTRAPRGMNPPETRSSGQSRPTGQHRLDPRDRVPSVRSGRRRGGRGWRQRQAGAHMPPSGAGFRSRSRGWREETTSFRGTVSTRSARGRHRCLLVTCG
jgi:hypothetical protein